MIQINDLPPEILIEIFEYLSSYNRLHVSTVCKEWLWLLRRSVFDMDRKLFLNDAVLKNESARHFILDSCLEYKAVHFHNVTNIEDNKNLWNRLGKSIQKIEINKSKAFLSDYEKDFLQNFQELTELTIVLNSNWKNCYKFDKIPVKLQKLRLIVDRYKASLDELNRMITRIADLKELEIESTSINNKDLFIIIKKFSSILTRLKISLCESNIMEFEQFDSFINLKNLCLILPDLQNECKLERLIQKYPNISYFELKINGFVPSKPYKNLKSLHIEQLSNLTTSAELEQIKCFTDLEILTIHYRTQVSDKQHCFFTHEILSNEKLHTLRIFKNCTSACAVCVENLSRSFPNLVTLKTNLPFVNEHLRILLRYLMKLRNLLVVWTPEMHQETLKIPMTYMTEFESLSLDSIKITNEHLINWPNMPKLTSVKINLDDNCTDDAFRRFISKMPSLEHLSFTSFATNGMVFAAVDGCKWLKSISTHCCKGSKVTNDGLSYVVKNASVIKKIEFHCIKNVSIEELKVLKKGNNAITIFTADSVKYL